MSADDARQCALWASYLSSELADDPETVEALLYATNYFVGYYEGRSGRPIAQGDDMAAGEEIIANLDAVTEKCADLMAAYGERMSVWGAALEAVDASAGKPGQ